MMKIDYTFHSHTYRCGHAVGDIEDYVPVAIRHGYKIYGVSDHAFLPGVHQKGTRGEYELLDEYIDVFNKCKEKYSKEIKMYLGFECEYSERFEDYYRYLLKEKGFDYLICGQHYYFHPNGETYYYTGIYSKGNIRGVSSYRDDIINAIKSGLFLYIAHPDMFFISAQNLTPSHKRVTKEIIEAAIKYDAVFELNIHGFLRNHYRNNVYYLNYPDEYFWKEVAKTNIRVVIGGDFHDPKEIGNRDYLDMFEKFVDECHIKFSDMREIYKEYRERIGKKI